MVIGVSGGLDSTHALIVAAKALRPARPAAHEDPRLHHARLRHHAKARRSNAWKLMQALGVTAEEIDIRPAATRMLRGHRPPLRRAASRSTTSPSKTCRRACGPITCSASPTSTTASWSAPATCRELALGWCTYGVGDQMSHYNVNGWRAEDADPVPDPLGRADRPVRRRRPTTVLGDPRHRDLARAGAGRRRRRDPETQAKIGPYELQDSTSTTSCASGCGRRRWRSSPGTPGATASAARGRRTSRRGAQHAYDLADDQEVARACSSSASSRSASSSARRMPNGPKVVSGGGLSPRGDWRAPSTAMPASGSTNWSRTCRDRYRAIRAISLGRISSGQL